MTTEPFDLGDCLRVSPTDGDRLAGASEQERQAVAGRLAELVRAEKNRDRLAEVVAYAAVHPQALVRLAVLQGLAEPDAHTDFLAWCLLDPDDMVVEAALGRITNNGIRVPAVLRSLLDRVGRDRVVASALARHAATAVERRMAELSLDLLSQPWAEDVLAELPAPVAGTELESRATTDGMLLIDARFSPAAGDTAAAFYLDKQLVSTVEYAKFLSAVDLAGHLYCHADEPVRKDHRPSRLVEADPSRDSDPVTGVDWYDACAFAAWAGKRLPSEAELEAACSLSPDGRLRDLEGPLWQWTDRRYIDRRAVDPRHGTREAYDMLGDWSAEVAVRGGRPSEPARSGGSLLRGRALLNRRSSEIGFRCALSLAEPER